MISRHSVGWLPVNLRGESVWRTGLAFLLLLITAGSAPAQPSSAASARVAQNQSASSRVEKDGAAKARRIALTFDAGASGEYVKTVLKALEKEGVTATFFITGEFARKYPELLKLIALGGHELGNHTWSHPDLRRLSAARIAKELNQTERAVMAICGVSTRPYFRPPFGARNAHVLKAAEAAGYECVFWTAGGQDAAPRYRGITAERFRKLILQKVSPGGVILCHLGSAQTAKMLPHLLQDLKAKGYTLTPVSELGSPLPR
ncbi:MAG: polysaccharide deacetylase family protein [Armatimonadetes bacterium]|nr:polysaccharide deacetylase family protein [Armatimonadota bacterium]